METEKYVNRDEFEAVKASIPPIFRVCRNDGTENIVYCPPMSGDMEIYRIKQEH